MNLKQILLVISLLFTMTIHAQELTIKEMHATNDLSASQYRKKDLNGEACALIKVQLATRGATFEGNVIQPVEYKAGEYWVYMTKGSQELRIKHPSFVPLHVKFADYGIEKGLQSLLTYDLTLLIPQSNGPIQTQKLTINYSPNNAMVLIDSEPHQSNGHLELTLPVGSHTYQVVAMGYETAEGSVKLTASQPRTITENLVATSRSLSVQQNTPQSITSVLQSATTEDAVIEGKTAAPAQPSVSTSSASSSSASIIARTVKDFDLISGQQPQRYSVVVGSFTLQANAEAVSKTLSDKGYSPTIIKESTISVPMFRVIGATTNDPNAASRIRDELHESYNSCWLMENPNAKGDASTTNTTATTHNTPITTNAIAPKTGTVLFNKNDLFESEDSYALSVAGKEALENIANTLKQSPQCHVKITAYYIKIRGGTSKTSAYKTAYKNAQLSEGRKDAIVDYLKSQGIEKDRIHEFDTLGSNKADAKLTVYVP